MIHEVCVYFLVMFSFSNLKVIQNHYLSFSVHGKIILFFLNMTKKEHLVRKLRGGKEKKANKGFISIVLYYILINYCLLCCRYQGPCCPFENKTNLEMEKKNATGIT